MSPRKMLLLAPHFPPCAAVAVHRILGLVRHLPAFGWESVVVAAPNSPHEPQDAGLTALVPTDSTTFLPAPHPEGYWGKINRRFAPDMLWRHRMRQTALAAIRDHRPDVLVSSYPTEIIHELGLELKKRTGLPWIADFRDPLCTLRRGTMTRREERSLVPLERETVALADRVIGNTPIFTDALRQAYPQHAAKISTITNGYDPEAFAEALTPPPRDRLSILYTGELYFGRDPRAFLDALVGLRTDPNAPKVGLEFVGRWDREYNLPDFVRERGLEEVVTIGGVIPYGECLRKTMQADILLLVHTPGYAHGLPAKIFEYLGARRPILVLTNTPGDIGWVLKEAGVLHRVAPIGDKAAIRQATLELAQEVRRGTPVSTGDASSFTRAGMARRFADQLDALVPAVKPILSPPRLELVAR
jgi:glycosyltransferase involved in cell wall biosynthesis